MKNKFRHYHIKEELESIYKDAIIVLDANSLLNIYRYNDENRKKYIEILKSVQKRLDVVRFRSVSCKADNVTISVKFCYIKAYSRRITTLNFGLTLLKPINKPVYMHLILSYRLYLLLPLCDCHSQVHLVFSKEH